MGFITDKRVTDENNVCTTNFMQRCENYNINLRVLGVSEAWHRFEVRRPNDDCNYGREVYAGEYYWHWRIRMGENLGIASFRTNVRFDREGSKYHHIEIFDRACSRMSEIEAEKAIEQFSEIDIIFESISTGKIYDFRNSRAETLINETDDTSFYTPIIGGCVSTSDFTWDSGD